MELSGELATIRKHIIAGCPEHALRAVESLQEHVTSEYQRGRADGYKGGYDVAEQEWGHRIHALWQVVKAYESCERKAPPDTAAVSSEHSSADVPGSTGYSGTLGAAVDTSRAAIEWKADWTGGEDNYIAGYFCPWCERIKPLHADDCVWRAVLDERDARAELSDRLRAERNQEYERANAAEKLAILGADIQEGLLKIARNETARALAAEKLLEEAVQLLCSALADIPPFPSYGMAGGTAMESRAQDAWRAKYGAFKFPQLIHKWLTRYNASRTTEKHGTWSVPAADTGLRLGSTESEAQNG